MGKVLFKYIILSWILVSLISCDAPRNNPLDPYNEESDLRSITGRVNRKTYKLDPIPEVLVFWENGSVITETDKNGKFRIDNIGPEDGYLKFFADGLSNDSVYVEWNGSKKRNYTILLNSEPVIEELEFYSSVINSYNRVDYEIVCGGILTDYDGSDEIDSVFLVNPEFQIKEYMRESSDYYSVSLSLKYINDIAPEEITLESLIGKQFDITVIDTAGASYIVSSPTIERVIKDEVILKSPLDQVAIPVSDSIKFSWERTMPGYEYYYMLQVYPANTEVVAKEVGFILPESGGYSMPAQSIGTGVYNWVVWRIDEFDNRSRSKKGTFEITNN